MSDLISRDFMKSLGATCIARREEDGELYALGAIDDLPSAQPERKKGEWSYGEKSGQDGWYCSECGFFVPWYYDFYGLGNIDFIADYHNCPSCNARMVKYTGMRGEQDDKS